MHTRYYLCECVRLSVEFKEEKQHTRYYLCECVSLRVDSKRKNIFLKFLSKINHKSWYRYKVF